MGYITTFLHSQLLVKLPYPTSDLSGQTIIITGANTGLGNMVQNRLDWESRA